MKSIAIVLSESTHKHLMMSSATYSALALVKCRDALLLAMGWDPVFAQCVPC